jgi:hypothetical protein
MINVVVFSKDRPAQLELFLRSMKRFFVEWNMVSTSILYRYSSEEYHRGYDKTMKYHPEFLYVLEEPGKFKEQVLKMINPAHNATMFFVDDIVFKNYWMLKSPPVRKFLTEDSILCLAIRLCPRINYCYTEKRDTPPPKFTSEGMWFWKDLSLKGDWSYPMSLDGNLFKTEDILPLLKSLSYENPNTLEGTLATHPIDKPYMVCYPDTLLFNIPVNKVQTANGNHCGSIPADYLNREFLKTKRISMSNLEFFKNTACHQEMPLILEDAVKYNADSLVSIIKERSVDYAAIAHSDGFIADIKESYADINLFVPKKGRDEFLKPFLIYANRSVEHSSKKIRIVVLENDDSPKSRSACKKLGADYIFVPQNLTNTEGLMAKALMYNIGYLNTPKAQWNIFHDLDILVDDDYFLKLESYLSRNPKWIQPYTKKRVLRLTGEITRIICSGDTMKLAHLVPLHARPANPGSPGGSIVVSSDFFEKVGGYDPELFYGYAPEDAFFWIKLECLFDPLGHVTTCFHGSATYADDPVMEVYHLEHESVESLNENRIKMREILESFLALEYEDKKRILDMKRELFAKQLVVGN